jgi:hypothetical protein
LVLFESGKFGCCVDQSPEHTRAIWQLVGTGADENAPLETPPEPRITLPRTWPATVLDRLIRDYSYWEGRGISATTVEPFRGGVATTGQLASRWVFPMFDENDDIIGFSARALKPGMQVKWKHLNPSSTFLWGGLDEIRETRRAILCESIGDVLALREHGVPESLCLFGLNMSQAVLGFLISANPEVLVISTNRDADPAKGQRAAQRIRTTLCAFFDEDRVSVVHPPAGSKDWGECGAEQIQVAFLTPAATPEDAPPEESAPEDPLEA